MIIVIVSISSIDETTKTKGVWLCRVRESERQRKRMDASGGEEKINSEVVSLV